MRNEAKKIKGFRKLSVSLTLAFLFVTVVVLLSASVSGVYFTFLSQQELIIEEERLIAQNAADTVRKYIDEKLGILETASNFSRLANVGAEEQKNILEKMFGVEPSFRQLEFLNPRMETLAGAYRLSRQASRQLADQAGENLFAQMSQKKRHAGAVYIDEITNEPMIILAVPVIDVFKDVKGILLAEVNLKFIWELVADLKVGDRGLAYVVDKSGNLLAFGDVSRVLKRENLGHLEEVAEFMGISETGQKKIFDVSKGILGTYSVTGYVPLDQPDWAVVVELPIEEAYAGVIQGVILSVCALAVIFLITLAIGAYLSRKIARPILQLKAAAVRIGQGDLETRIDIKSKNEIGELASAINQTAENLKKSRQEIEDYSRNLEQKVEEKTADLNTRNEELEEFNQNISSSQKALLNLVEDVERAKKEVEEENLRRIAIMESMKEGLVVVDSENKIVAVNPIAERIFSVQEEDLLGQDAAGKFKNQKIDEVLALKEMKTNIFEISVESEEGKVFKAIVSPVVAPAGEILGKVMVLQNLTREREIEDMRKQFVSITAHELRTPLGAAKWSLELLKGGDAGKLTEEQLQLVGQLYDSNQRLLDIVADLLEVSRLDEGRFKVEAKVCQIEDLVDGVVANFIPKIQEQKQQFIWNKPKVPLPSVKADSNRLIQVLTNLLGNAVKFTPKNKKIEITAEEVSRVAPPEVIPVLTAEQESKKYVQIMIKDEGIGIPKDEQKKIFGRFFRASNTQEKQIEGTGLGLNIVKSIVELHNGAIWFDSEEGKGTAFYFTLPVA